MKLKRLYKALTHPSDVVEYLVQKTCLPDKMSDESYLKLIYWIKFHKKLNLDNPVTFNEKLQWLKLHDHNPCYVKMVDKITAKEYVANIIGWDYIIPTIAVYDSVDDIKFNELPHRFVLKTNHSGGNSGVVICKDKRSFDFEDAKRKLSESLKSNMYRHSREWPYKEIKPRILAEEFITDIGDGDLKDYKFFCFDGEVKSLFVGTERMSGDVKFDFFDADFNHLDLVQTHPMSGKQIQKPENFEKMKDLASLLSKGFPHVRVDLYNIDGQIYFGEMTLYHHGGFYPFHPEHWDKDFGSWIKEDMIKHIINRGGVRH